MQRAFILCATIALLKAGSGTQENGITALVRVSMFRGGRGGGGGPGEGQFPGAGDPGSERILSRTPAAGFVMGLRGGSTQGETQSSQQGRTGWRGGGRGRGRGRGGRGGRGGVAANKGPGAWRPLPYGPQSSPLEDFLGEEVHVTYDGGMEMRGIMTGYDHLGNLVMENTTQYLMEKGEDDELIWTGKTRKRTSTPPPWLLPCHFQL
jgi:small nuclear ribonucleoprotein (snRNP)-like protein